MQYSAWGGNIGNIEKEESWGEKDEKGDAQEALTANQEAGKDEKETEMDQMTVAEQVNGGVEETGKRSAERKAICLGSKSTPHGRSESVCIREERNELQLADFQVPKYTYLSVLSH
jgi:hypothetical protein